MSEHTPLVSVILPAYNAAEFLRLAINSILAQDFTDFELLIINDGSTDDTIKIVEIFSDKRIRLFNNEKNLGLVQTLNKGIDLARGNYVARMDADDISFPSRLSKQVAYLEKHPEASMLFAKTELINRNGDVIGKWSDDVMTGTPGLRRTMAFTNCVAHPTVMGRTEIFKTYKYSSYQQSAEDWDLWLRLLADGHSLHKLDEVLLQYRMHPKSLMADEKKISYSKRVAQVKRKFLLYRFPKLNGYFFLVFYSWMRSVASHYKYDLLPEILRSLKRILTTSPFKVSAQYRLFKKILAEHDTQFFFFFPYTHVGGAERVHADIVRAFADKKPIVFFTAFSKDDKFLSKFKEYTTVLAIPEALNYPFIHKKCIRLVSEHINNKKKATVLGCNSGFFYEVAEKLKSHVQSGDLIHAFKYQPQGNVFHKKYLPLSRKFSFRIFISQAAREEFRKFCFHNAYTADYFEKLKLIYNSTEIKPFARQQTANPLRVIFVGRNSPEKRMHLFLAVTDELNKNHAAKFTFTVIGSAGNHPGVHFVGEVNDDNKMSDYYNASDILVLTSEREGFPLVIMEAMAHGVVPVSTPVGDVPFHITDRGFVTSSIEPETVVKEITQKLLSLDGNRKHLADLSVYAHQYASTTFSRARFEQEYKSLLGA